MPRETIPSERFARHSRHKQYYLPAFLAAFLAAQ